VIPVAEAETTADLLEVCNLTIAYGIGTRAVTAVDDVSLRLRSREILAIVGESGAGKSTLASGLLGLADPPARIVRGEVRLAGRAIDLDDEAAMRRIRGRRIGLVVQDTQAALDPLCTVGRHLTETITTHLPVDRREARARAIEALRSVGITGPELRLGHYPHQFSGGMRQRLVVALAICAKPELVIADEPTTNLDAPRKRQILDLLGALCRDHEMGLILVSHDIGLVGAVADRVMVMRRGRIVEAGAAGDVLGNPMQPYTRELIRAVPPARRRQRLLPRAEAPVAAEGSASVALAKAWLVAGRRFEPSGLPLLELDEVTMTFVLRRSWLASRRRSERAVDRVTLEIQPGEMFGLVGESGSGKSTLARIASGLYQPVSGKVRFAGADLQATLAGRGGLEVRRQVQMVFQDPFSSLDARWRVLDIIAEPIRLHGLTGGPAETRDVVRGLFGYVGLDAHASDRYPHQFSAGQRQRIALARALAARPRFLICDEPTSALDVVSQEIILRLLAALRQELGMTVLLISHDLAVIRQTCDRVAVMRAGRLCEIAATETLFEHPQHPYTRELLALLPRDLPGSAGGGTAVG